ncbi:UDP-N-acetylmuramate dehydrogenase [Rhodobacteraceae bacterium]|nr:UDP-N-acetylmuramate dehydrogenase [Paracoccaceae bacterium]
MADVSSIAIQGRITPNYDLSGLTWLRAGGPADWLFLPKDVGDLSAFLGDLPMDVAVFPMGVGSNLIVRDGGLRAVVIRLGRAFADVTVEGDTVTAGAGALDAQVAKRAAEAGLDLTFLRTIPGAIGGAVRMNAGCYGSYVADHLVSADVIMRDGTHDVLGPTDFNFRYRQSDLAEGAVIVSAKFRAEAGDPDALVAKMEAQLAKRNQTQPTKALTAGSTFRNPAGFSSTGKADDTHELKAWKVIDDAGMRGAMRGAAQMSEMHSNFLVNTGGATAADLEELGEDVREAVFQSSGIRLEWEVLRVGEPTPEAKDE